MKKKVIIIVLTILLISIITIGILISRKNSNELELTYEINAGIPYRWEYEIEDESIVKFVKSYVIRDDNKDGIVGASIYTNYVFEGLKEGKTHITFKYVNFVDNIVEKEENHTVRVDKRGKISLVMID